MEVSVVIPVFNEEENVQLLYQAITDALRPTAMEYEVVLVDDGSSDGTLGVLRGIASRDSRVSVLKLRSNFGQTVAMREGIEHACGEIVITMDGDLQNDPRDIPMIVNKLREGYDVVSGWRKSRQDRLVSRKVPSVIANRIIRWITGVSIHDTGCALKAYRGDVIRQLPLYSDMHRFIPAMCTLATSRFAEVVVHHHARRFGKSKYGLSRIGKVMLDILTVKMIISFSRRPMHWFATLSLPFVGLAVPLVGWLVFLPAVAGPRPTVVPMTLLFLLSFISVQLILSGVFAEFVVRTEPSLGVRPLSEPLFGDRQVSSHN